MRRYVKVISFALFLYYLFIFCAYTITPGFMMFLAAKVVTTKDLLEIAPLVKSILLLGAFGYLFLEQRGKKL